MNKDNISKEGTIIPLFKFVLPWCATSVQDGDGCGDVNGQCLWEMDFWNQNTGWNDQTVKKEGDPVCNDLPNKEKGIDKVDLLPDRHTLHNKTR